MSRSITKRITQIIDNERVDNRERLKCLRLQATAWRQVALVATADPARGAQLAQWLLFHSVPFVDEAAVNKLIADTEQDAVTNVTNGTKSGVFTSKAAA